MYRNLYLLTIFLILPLWVNAQFNITGMAVSPPVPLECSTLVVGVTGQHACGNAMLNGTGSTVSGSTIFLNIDVSQPLICLPVIVPYTVNISVGLVPAGTYNLTAQYILNGVIVETQIQSVTIGSCCSVDPAFTASQLKICPGDSISFGVNDTSLASVEWKLDGVPVSTNDSVLQTFNTPGTYTMTLVGDDGSCVDSSSQTVTVVNYPQLNIAGVTIESCAGSMDGSIDLAVLSGLGPFTYQWSDGSTNQDPTQLAGGWYTVVVSDSIGCSSTDSAEVLVGPSVTAAFTVSDSVICLGDSVITTNSSAGAQAYIWEINGQAVSANTDLSFQSVISGSATVTLIAIGPTCSDTVSVPVMVSAPPSMSFSTTPTGCPNAADGAISASVSGGFSPYIYSWSNGDTTQNLSQVAGGNYILTVTDSLGCSGVDSVVLGTGPGPVAAVSATDSGIVCLGDQVDFTNTSTGGTSYLWFNNGVQIGTSPDQSVSFPDTGSFEILMVVGDSVCNDSLRIMITVPELPSSTAMVMNEICPADSNGSIDLTPVNGVGPYTYEWSVDSTSEDISGLGAGIYVVTITDSEGCTGIDSIEVGTSGGAPADFDFGFGTTGVIFNDRSDSTVTAWAWDFGDGATSTSQNPVHLYDLSGVYLVCLTVTDMFGCISTACDTVSYSVGIEPESIPSKNIYPNPTSGFFSVKISSLYGKQVQIGVFDMTGRKVIGREETVISPSLDLDLSGEAKGTYMIYILSGEKVMIGKIIKR